MGKLATFKMNYNLLIIVASVLVLAPLDFKNVVAARSCPGLRSEGITLFNFTDPNVDMSGWEELSDTVRKTIVGQSKATLVLQKTNAFQRGICFAGMRHPVKLELAPASVITLNMRSQGQNTYFKVILRHHGQMGDQYPTYEHTFQVPPGGDLRPVFFGTGEFQPFINGILDMDADPLDRSDITDFGIQVAGGFDSDYKQSGPAALEIDWISAANYC